MSEALKIRPDVNKGSPHRDEGELPEQLPEGYREALALYRVQECKFDVWLGSTHGKYKHEKWGLTCNDWGRGDRSRLDLHAKGPDLFALIDDAYDKWLNRERRHQQRVIRQGMEHGLFESDDFDPVKGYAAIPEDQVAEFLHVWRWLVSQEYWSLHWSTIGNEMNVHGELLKDKVEGCVWMFKTRVHTGRDFTFIGRTLYEAVQELQKWLKKSRAKEKVALREAAQELGMLPPELPLTWAMAPTAALVKAEHEETALAKPFLRGHDFIVGTLFGLVVGLCIAGAILL